MVMATTRSRVRKGRAEKRPFEKVEKKEDTETKVTRRGKRTVPKPFEKVEKKKDTKPFKKVEKERTTKPMSRAVIGEGFNIGKAEKKATELGKKADTVAKKSKEVLADKPKTPPKPPPKVKADKSTPDYKSYKSLAAAKKAGSLYYDKDGKKMAAVTKEDLKESGMSLRDYLNKEESKKRSGKFITSSKEEMEMDRPRVTMPKMKKGGKMTPKEKAVADTRRRLMLAGAPMYEKDRGARIKAPKEGLKGPTRSEIAARKAEIAAKKEKYKDSEGKKGGGMMKTKGYSMGGLKKPTADQKGLKKLPTEVRNKMGYMKGGGMMKTKGYAKGGMKTKGYAKGGMKKMMGGGMAMGMDPRKKRKDMMGLGAATTPMMEGGGMMKTKMNTKGGMKGGGMMKTKGYAKGSTVKTKGGVRGAGIARKGVRKAKML
jgi:hypothetical protein